jgi:hypothetical protein
MRRRSGCRGSAASPPRPGRSVRPAGRRCGGRRAGSPRGGRSPRSATSVRPVAPPPSPTPSASLSRSEGSKVITRSVVPAPLARRATRGGRAPPARVVLPTPRLSPGAPSTKWWNTGLAASTRATNGSGILWRTSASISFLGWTFCSHRSRRTFTTAPPEGAVSSSWCSDSRGSVSSTRVRRPRSVSPWPMAAASVLLPTPPLPVTTTSARAPGASLTARRRSPGPRGRPPP